MIKDPNDYIIKDGRKWFKCQCSQCGIDRGYKREAKALALCRNCAQENLAAAKIEEEKHNYPNVDFSDFISHGPKQSKKFKASCPVCNKDKGYLSKSNLLKPCLSCARIEAHKNMTPETKAEMSRKLSENQPSEETKKKISESLKGNPSPMKGKTHTKESKKKMSEANKGKPSWLKGKSLPLEQRIRRSCRMRGIEVSEFDGFTTATKKKERDRVSILGLNKKCFEKYDYTCQMCQKRGTTLNAHHIKPWAQYPELRYELNNLICLCVDCHKAIHKLDDLPEFDFNEDD